MAKEIDDLNVDLKEAHEATVEARSNGDTEKLNKAVNAMGDIEARMAQLETAQARMDTRAAEQEEVETSEEIVSFADQIRSASNAEELHFRAGSFATTNVDAAGRLVADADRDPIVDQMFDMGAVYSRARKVNVSGNQLRVPYQKSDFAVLDVAEAADRDATDVAEFGEIVIDVHQTYATVLLTPEMLEDTDYPLESWAMSQMGGKFARVEANRFVNGSGAGQIKGILASVGGAADSADSVESVTTAGAAIAFSDLRALDASMRDQAVTPSSILMMNRGTWENIVGLEDSSNVLIDQPFQNGPGMYRSLFGHDVVIDDYMPDAASGTSPILYGDIGQAYTIIEKRNLTVQRLNEKFLPHIGLYATKRTGGSVTNGQFLRALTIAA